MCVCSQMCMNGTTISEIPVLGRSSRKDGKAPSGSVWDPNAAAELGAVSLDISHTCINAAVWYEKPGQSFSLCQHPMPVPKILPVSSEGAAGGSGQEKPPAQGFSACLGHHPLGNGTRITSGEAVFCALSPFFSPGASRAWSRCSPSLDRPLEVRRMPPCALRAIKILPESW